MTNMGASAEPTGLGSSEEPEPHSRLRPTGAIPCAAHTPLPWSISHGYAAPYFAAEPAHYVSGPKAESVGIKLASPWREGAWDDDPEAKANAEFIVHACNAHYELVAALREALDMVVDATRDGNYSVSEFNALVALAAAGGRRDEN
jgi:hypothetical protein